jgi:hypothetical protein
VFEQDYNHTYVKNIIEPQTDSPVRPVNVDILKKFKKELPTDSVSLNNAEIIKKAQNKFDELRRNAKSHEIVEENEVNQIESDENL